MPALPALAAAACLEEPPIEVVMARRPAEPDFDRLMGRTEYCANLNALLTGAPLGLG